MEWSNVPLAKPVVTIPAGAPPAKINSDTSEEYFLQYEVAPAEYCASFALDSDVCFSRIVPALPVTSPVSSITTI